VFVKLSEPDPGRPRGRERVRILHDSTNRLVSYPNGRARWFGSEAAADAWIREAHANPAQAEAVLLERFT
jgi:hypothetical protein